MSVRDQPPSFGSWGTDINPSLYLIQERIHGMTLYEYVKQPEFTLDVCQRIIKQVWTTLIALSVSPYQLYHNDLHGGNIMVKPDGTIVILDWGLSRFTIGGITYDSSHIGQYTDYSYATGAPDLYRLIKSILTSISLTNPKRSVLVDYLFSILDRLCSHFYEETNVDELFWLATLSEKRKREAVKKEQQELYQKEIDKLRARYGKDTEYFEDALFQLQQRMFSVLLQKDKDDEDDASLAEIWPPQKALEFVRDGIFLNLSRNDLVYSLLLRKKYPEYKEGIPLIHDTEDMLFPPEGHRNLFKLLIDLEKHTSSRERQSELHALHLLKLQQMTYEYLGEHVLHMSKEEIEATKQVTQNDEPIESGKKKKRMSKKKKK
jgi:serine/threonine protein kinase